MKAINRKQFLDAIDKKINDQMNNNNFNVIHWSQIPEGATLLPTIWQMCRKRDIKTNEITKYKARLSVDGSKTRKGEYYDKTYALVASWKSIHLLTTLATALS